MTDLDDLAARVAARETTAIARAISIVEDRRRESQARIAELLAAVRKQGSLERCHRIGITGPPGVGKSSLVSALAKAARLRKLGVGVLAVDPSSPRSGGALLGDRARIEIEPDDAGLFVRLMASGGHLGGLARAAGAAIDVLSAAFDLVMVETTGVGQSETDVEHVTDTVVLVIQPGSGDVLQFLKAGIVEIPDLFVVNKADLGDLARRAGSDLSAALGVVHAGGAASLPGVWFVSATAGQGISELLDAVLAHRRGLENRGELAGRRARSAAAWALRLYAQRFGDAGVEAAGGSAALLGRLEARIAAGETAVEAAAAAEAELLPA